jgi:class 3 adenylate cyclase
MGDIESESRIDDPVSNSQAGTPDPKFLSEDLLNVPSCTLTFLFTDIEGSTRLWDNDESRMVEALDAHDETLRRVVEEHGGRLFKHTGDGIRAAFYSAQEAVAAAVAAQRSLKLPVRMGVHSGEAFERGPDFFGPALNRTARLMDAGHGGQILLSNATANLIKNLELRDLGEHRLRDLARAEHIFQVLGEGLIADFPPLRLLSPFPTNLPAQRSVEAVSWL